MRPPETSDNVLIRRNSSVVIHGAPGCRLVTKKYHDKYSIQDEVAYYRAITPLVENLTGLVLPVIYGYDFESGELDLEYIEGRTLQEGLLLDGLSALKPIWFTAILELCAESSRQQLALDADLSNFVCDAAKDRLVFIDPLMNAQGVEHVSIAVFLWGLVKYRVRRIYRISDYMFFFYLWRDAVHEYSRAVGCHPADIYTSLSNYSDNVVEWNLRESGSETATRRVVRLLAVAPLWWCVGRYFRVLGKLAID